MTVFYVTLNYLFFCLGSVTVDKSPNSRKYTFNDVVIKFPAGRYNFVYAQNLQFPWSTDCVQQSILEVIKMLKPLQNVHIVLVWTCIIFYTCITT
jgi:hypothetical protein